MTSLIRDNVRKHFHPSLPSVAEFAESSEFCGKPLYPLQRILLKTIFLEELEPWEEDLFTWMINGGRNGEIVFSPDIRKRIEVSRNRGYSHFSEINFVGGRRSSKGYLTGLAGAYKLYSVHQIPDPGKFYNIDPDKVLDFICVAASHDQAKTLQFADLRSSITNCKPLMPYIGKDLEEILTIKTDSDADTVRELETMGVKVARDFAKLRVRPMAANSDTIRGTASLFLVFDEMAFMMPGESRQSAQQVYSAAEPSLAQFGHHSLIFCNPPEAPILMGNLSFKPIGDIQVGDVVAGWEVRESGRRHFVQSKVQNVISRKSPIVKVTMESGRVFRCTPDHRWLTLSSGGNRQRGDYQVKGEWFAPPKEGRVLAHIVDPTPDMPEGVTVNDVAWLSGIIDGEGHISSKQAITIAQSRQKNPEVCAEIERILDLLNIEWVYDGWEGKQGHGGAYRLLGGGHAGSRQLYVDLSNWLGLVKGVGLVEKFMQAKRQTPDKIVSVEEDGFGEVIALTTETGNYVCNGYASKNCNSSPYTRIGQFFEQYELAMRDQQHKDGWYPARFALQFPSWALFDMWWKDPQTKWRNAIMVSPDWPDELEPGNPASALDNLSQGKREEEGLKEKANKETYKVERRAQWAEVLDAYFDPTVVDKVFNGRLPDGRPLAPNFNGNYLFEFKGHCDPSSTTAGFGFAMAHVEEFPDPTGIFPDGIARHVVFDFVKRWNPQDFPGGTINYIKVREELAYWLDMFRPTALTFDQYNSVGLIQELREAQRALGAWNCHIGEVKATAAINWNRWEATKTAFNLGLVHIPPGCIDPKTGFDHSEYAKQELKFLQEVQTGQTKRVDKQELGPIQTKDIADCISEVTVKFLASYLGNFMAKNLQQAQIQYGAEGGYQIGGRNPHGPGEPRGGERFTGFGGKDIDATRTRGFAGRDFQRGQRRY